MNIKLKIKDCSQCPHSKIERQLTPDPFEMCSKWTCIYDAGNHKVIENYLETFDKVKIPEFCPFKYKNKNKCE